MNLVRFSLLVKPPFRLDLTVWSLKRRESNAVDHWDGEKYIRILVIEKIPIKIEVTHEKNRVLVLAKSSRLVSQLKARLAVLLNTMLGLKIDLARFYRLSEQDKILHPLVRQFKGVKPPRFPTLFETLVNAITFQQLSLEAGFSLLNKLVDQYGLPFKDEDGTFHAFPVPGRIMKCKIEELKALGYSHRKSESLIEIASQVEVQQIDFHSLESLSNEEIVGFLCCFKGLGRWSGEYALLRGFGRIAILPGDDVGIHKSLKILLKRHQEIAYEKVKQLEQRWYPYAGLVYFHLLLHKLRKKGIL